MSQPKKCTVIKSLLVLVLLSGGALAHAAPPVGTVSHLSGPLLATKADGTVRVLGLQSVVEADDTLSTQRRGYAQIRFIDDSQLILQPETVIGIDAFSYEADQPELDHSDFTLTQGGVRTNAGLIGKRSKDRVSLTTPLAKIDMKNASAVVRYVPVDAAALAATEAYLFASTAALDASWTTTRSDSPEVTAIRPLVLAQVQIPVPTGMTPTVNPRPSSALPPGLYVQVIDGLINVSNKGGTQNFSAGQFGFTPSPTQPPTIVPKNPALQFTPPPAFNAPPPISGSAAAPKSNAVDCEVR